MDLLSLVSMSTKRRGDFFSQAEALAKKYKDQPALEKRMMVESKTLVTGLRDKQMRWEEYARSLLEKTLISALAAVYLGSEGNEPRKKMERAWPTIVGDMLPPLVKFLSETNAYLEDGTLRLGDKTMDFADCLLGEGEDDEDCDWEPFNAPSKQDPPSSTSKRRPSEPVSAASLLIAGALAKQNPSSSPPGAKVSEAPSGRKSSKVSLEKSPQNKSLSVSDEILKTSPEEQNAIEAAKKAAVGRTWGSLLGRVIRYIANPSYSFFNLGQAITRQDQGYKEMRRIPTLDSRTCKDCIHYGEQGWQPIGSLPMPGRNCRCYDRCRCSIEYR